VTLADASLAAPVGLRIVLLVVLAGLGVPLAVVGVLGWRQRLPMNGRLGVRTEAALRSAAAFRLANRVAGLPVLVSGVVAVLAGVAAFGLPTTTASVVSAVIGLVGSVLIARAGGVLGDRAAGALPVDRVVPPQCAGCACGGCAVLGR
jgi:uncharacterized membrane protein